MCFTFPLKNWAQSMIARRVIAVSPAVAESLVRRGTPRGRLAVVPNGLVVERVDRPVSAAEVEAWRQRIGWTPTQRTIGIVSRPKQHHVVLEALAHVRTPVRLVCAGVDPASDIGRLAAAVGPPHTVVCVPFDQAVRPLYELLEMSLLSSRIDGLSQTMLESMALGKPMLASNLGGFRDVIRDGVNGLLLPPDEPEAWARAIDEVLGDPAYAARLAEAGRRTAREEYSHRPHRGADDRGVRGRAARAVAVAARWFPPPLTAAARRASPRRVRWTTRPSRTRSARRPHSGSRSVA